MCKEDVRIKRKTVAKSVKVDSIGGTPSPALPTNPSRVSLIVGVRGYVWDSPLSTLEVYAGNTTDAPILATLSAATPSVVLRVEDVGILVTYDISVASLDANNPNVTVSEVFFNEALSDL